MYSQLDSLADTAQVAVLHLVVDVAVLLVVAVLLAVAVVLVIIIIISVIFGAAHETGSS